MLFTKETVDKIFAKATHQADVLIELYKAVYGLGEWECIDKIQGYPSCGRELGEYIMGQFIRFDHNHHPDVMAGGCWMNSGFSVHDDESPWEVTLAPVTYK